VAAAGTVRGDDLDVLLRRPGLRRGGGRDGHQSRGCECAKQFHTVLLTTIVLPRTVHSIRAREPCTRCRSWCDRLTTHGPFALSPATTLRTGTVEGRRVDPVCRRLCPMTLILSNQDAEELLPMSDCVAALEESYRELAHERAASALRSDAITTTDRPDTV